MARRSSLVLLALLLVFGCIQESNSKLSRGVYRLTSSAGRGYVMRFRQASRSKGRVVPPTASEAKQYSKDKARICDTPNQCKSKVVSNKLTCCNICVDDLNLDEHPYKWGFYEYLDNPPWAPQGALIPSPPPASSEEPKTEADAEKAAIAIAGDTPCPEGALDDFIKPCCRPCKKSMLSQRKVTGFRYGAFPTQKLKNCCATGESCCRWCPQYVCPYLEEGYYIPKLWYALCSNYDGDLNPQSINVA